MNTGTISYSAPCKDISFDEAIEVEKPAPSIERIVIATEPGDRITLTVYVIDIYDIQDATPIIQPVVERLLNRIAFSHNCQIGEVRSFSFSLPHNEKKSYEVLTSQLNFSDHAEAIITLNTERRDELKAFLVVPESERDSFMRVYRVAINKTDPVVRFMLLYNLLLSISSDKQAAVDAQIKRLQPDVEQSISPKIGKPETIYTRLRNEISHSREGCCPTEAVDEISSHIQVFQDIVRKSIPKG